MGMCFDEHYELEARGAKHEREAIITMLTAQRDEYRIALAKAQFNETRIGAKAAINALDDAIAAISQEQHNKGTYK